MIIYPIKATKLSIIFPKYMHDIGSKMHPILYKRAELVKMVWRYIGDI